MIEFWVDPLSLMAEYQSDSRVLGSSIQSDGGVLDKWCLVLGHSTQRVSSGVKLRRELLLKSTYQGKKTEQLRDTGKSRQWPWWAKPRWTNGRSEGGLCGKFGVMVLGMGEMGSEEDPVSEIQETWEESLSGSLGRREPHHKETVTQQMKERLFCRA